MNVRSAALSMRYTPPWPPQVQFLPNEVTTSTARSGRYSASLERMAAAPAWIDSTIDW